MGQRCRRRMAVFQDPKNIEKLFRLPLRLLQKYRKRDGADHSHIDLSRIMAAIGLTILPFAPVRVGNLTAIRLDRHLYATGPNLTGDVWLEFQAHEVKNRIDLRYPIPDRVADVLRWYLRDVHPHCAPDSPFLFPGRRDIHRDRCSFSSSIGRLVRRELGFELHTHMLRHIVAYDILRKVPGAYELVRQILGHKSLNTTTRSYTGLEQADNVARYQRTLTESFAFDLGEAA